MFLLHSLQSPINVGMILRSAEVYGQAVMILDTHKLMRGDKLQIVADFACGALGRRPPIVETQLAACLDRVKGRLIGTGFGPSATPLQHMSWKPGDCVILGNEYDGLRADEIQRLQTTVWVPTPDKHLPKPRSTNPIDPNRTGGVRNDGGTSLNVAATAAIIAYEMFQANIGRIV
jgi:tRNA G18 (ribose-2'-O)-methylase SpoU